MPPPTDAVARHIVHHGADASYRPDIDGLRGIAVLTVVVYHAFPAWLPGGFIGVDVFFVISGFLITTIIQGGMQAGTFSLAHFYSRRIRRILPALLLVLTGCLVAGWYLLLAVEYKQLGKHVAAGAGFASNLALWAEGGYFDDAADTKPLLHLWSLGIEEQFYIVWPLVLWITLRRRQHLLALIVALGVLSFLLNLHALRSDALSSFYSPLTRVWELLVGGGLAVLSSRGTAGGRAVPARANVLSAMGLVLLCSGLLFVSSERAFPGFWALPPTIGAALVIQAGPQAWPNRMLLAHRWLVWFGLISFPLYLWHWPLLTFARIVDGQMPPREMRAGLVLLSVLLAWLTYRLVEKPIRLPVRGSLTTASLLVGLIAVGLTGYAVHHREGFEGHGFRDAGKQAFADYFENSLPGWRYYERTGALASSRVECNFYDLDRFKAGSATRRPRAAIDPDCHERDPARPRAVLIWGDSHAQQLNHGLTRNLPAEWQVLQVASSDCRADSRLPEDSELDHCQRSNWFAMQTVRLARPEAVVVAQEGGHDIARMELLASDLKAAGVQRVILLGPAPRWTAHLPRLVMRRHWPDTPERMDAGVDRSTMAANRRLLSGFRGADGVVLVDVIGVFCNAAGCLTRIGDDRMTGITTYDTGHLTPIASDYLARQVLAELVIGQAAEQ